MKEFVAVAHPTFAFNKGALKQQALMFRRIGIPTLSSILSATLEETKDIRRNLEWLREAGIVFEPTVDPAVKVSSAEHERTLDLLREDGKSGYAPPYSALSFRAVPWYGLWPNKSKGQARTRGIAPEQSGRYRRGVATASHPAAKPNNMVPRLLRQSQKDENQTNSRQRH